LQTTGVFSQRVQVPYARESLPEALVSRKLVFREGCSEGSGTTNSGTDEQKRYTRPRDEDKQAHLCDVRTLKSSHGRCRSDWRKGRAFTGGGLTIHVLDNVRSQLQVIVATANEPPSDRRRSEGRSEGLNVKLFQIRQGGLDFEFTSLALKYDKGFIGEKSDEADT